jgi:glycosyltransferase involved in cell wall biosynthesis
MSTNADVTVAISCFNYGEFLPEAVDSALAQAGGEPRVIVVDDGSSDGDTLAALERLPPQVQVISQHNAGVAAARNAALEASQTPYVLVLDADDRLAQDAIATLREPLERDPQLGFAYGLIRFFGAWEGLVKFPPYDPYGLLFRHNIGSTALMRRSLAEDIGGFDPDFPGYEDWEFWVHALARGWRGRRVEQVALLYRRHEITRHLRARAGYRGTYRQLRRKHADLYRREGRRRLAAESELGPLARLVYRGWWGWRPLPARLELALQSLLWRAK